MRPQEKPEAGAVQGFGGDLLKAWGREAHCPGGVLGWALKFCQTDFNALGRGGWLETRFEISQRALNFYNDSGNFHFDAKAAAELSGWHQNIDVKKYATLHGGTLSAWQDALEEKFLPSSSDVLWLQAQIKQIFSNLASHGEAFYTFSHVTIRVGSPWIVDDSEQEIHGLAVQRDPIFEAKNPSEGIIGDVLMKASAHTFGIRVCTGCNRFFLATRKEQRFCSSRCLNRVATRKRRGTPPERIGKRGRPTQDKPGARKPSQKGTQKKKKGA